MRRCSRASKTTARSATTAPFACPYENGGPSARLREYGLSPSCFENSPSRMFFYVKLYPEMLDFAFWGLYLCGVVFHHRFSQILFIISPACYSE